jgi:hypothetical protein
MFGLADAPADKRSLDRWIGQLLAGQDVPGEPGWQSRVLGGRPSEVLAQTPDDAVHQMQVVTSRRLARALTQAAAKHGLSRSMYLRLVLVHLVAEDTGTDPVEWFDDIGPGRKALLERQR